MSKGDTKDPVVNPEEQKLNQPVAQDTFGSTSSLNVLQGSVGGDSVDPITEAIRKEILEKQREQIRLYLSTAHPELEEQTKDDEEFKKFLAQLNAQQRGFIDDALKNEKVKAELEKIELAGYKNIHNTFSANKYPGGFRKMEWDGPAQESIKSQVVENGVGEPICTLTETTHNIAPITVKQGDKDVTINSYRTVDFPIKLEGKTGTMHLSMVALDENGQRPPVDQAVYFTAHYEATPAPDGQPKLKEVSSPQPLKFLGEGKDAVGYIEHGGKIYTLPVTRGKYQEMMKEVAINKGQSIDISQTIEVTAKDLIKNEEKTVTPQTPSRAEKPVEYENTEIPKSKPVLATSINTPKQPDISPMPQPQSGISSNQEQTVFSESQKIQQPQQSQVIKQRPLLDAATELAKSMHDLLNYVNAGLTNETGNDKKIDLIKNAAEAVLKKENSSFADKQAGIQALSENILKSTDLNGNAKIQGISAILETINNNTNLAESEKVDLLKGISATVLKANNLEKDTKQQILENITDSALKLNDSVERWKAIDGIAQSVIDSGLKEDEKGNILVAMGNRVNASKLELPEKNQLVSDILDKGKEDKVLSKEQQQQMQQNIDALGKGGAEQDTKSGLYNAAQGVADALRDVIDPILKANPEKRDVSKEEIVEKNLEILSKSAPVHPAHKIRESLSSNNINTTENTKAESEQQVKNLVADYQAIDAKYKPQYEQQGKSYDPALEFAAKKDFIKKAGLGDKEKIKLLSAAIQYERDNNASKPGVNNSVNMLTENRSNVEKQVAIQGGSKVVGYDSQLKPREDLGISVPKVSKNIGRTP